jgi:hypothetical protein
MHGEPELMNAKEMIKVYRTSGIAFRLAKKTMKKMVELAFEGELIARQRNSEDVFSPEVRFAAARDALRKVKLPILKEEEPWAKDLVEREVERLATHEGQF